MVFGLSVFMLPGAATNFVRRNLPTQARGPAFVLGTVNWLRRQVHRRVPGWRCADSVPLKRGQGDAHSGQLERRHGLHQLLRLDLQAFCGGGALFDQRGVLLGGLVHLADGLAHLLHAAALL